VLMNINVFLYITNHLQLVIEKFIEAYCFLFSGHSKKNLNCHEDGGIKLLCNNCIYVPI
jgi:hypothetical protein